ncbi:hypothetical protein [Verrucomicrobium spinosum]|nr:hypothetical protein [Verrucomicrobium spinosum]
MSKTAEPAALPSSRKEISRKTVFRFVVLTVLATLVGLYVNALLTFAGNTYSFNNRFTEVAMVDHWFYLLWSNVEVLKGYLLVALVYVLVIYPLVLVWQRFQTFGRWGVVWRSLLFSGVLYGFFIFRLMLNKPYFGDFSYFDQGYRKFGEWFGGAIQGGAQFFVLYIFPTVALAICVAFYALELRKAWKKNPRFFPWPVIGPIAILVAFVVSGHGFVRDAAPVEEVGPPKLKPKNILIIASDSLRADRLSCNGYFRPTSPSIDKLAKEG